MGVLISGGPLNFCGCTTANGKENVRGKYVFSLSAHYGNLNVCTAFHVKFEVIFGGGSLAVGAAEE